MAQHGERVGLEEGRGEGEWGGEVGGVARVGHGHGNWAHEFGLPSRTVLIVWVV